MKNIIFDKTGNYSTTSINEAYRCGMVASVIQDIVNKIVDEDNDFTFVKKVEGTLSNGRMYGRWFIDVGAIFYVYIEYVSSTANSGSYGITVNIGLCKIEDTETVNYIASSNIGSISVQQKNVNVDGTNYYYGYINSGFWYITNSGKLNGIFALSNTQPTNASFNIFGKDIFDKKYILLCVPANQNGNAFYYFDDETLTNHTIEVTTRAFNTEGYVLSENIPILKNNVIVSLTGAEFLKIHNGTLSTAAQTSGTIIMVDNKKYRKMNYSYWLLDNDD